MIKYNFDLSFFIFHSKGISMNGHVGLILGAVMYGLFQSIYPMVTAFTSVALIVAVYTTVSTSIAWAVVFASGQHTELVKFSPKGWGLLLLLGVMSYTADYLWARGFALKVNPFFIYAVIGSIPVFAVLFGFILHKDMPNKQEIFAIALAVVAAYLAHTARP